MIEQYLELYHRQTTSGPFGFNTKGMDGLSLDGGEEGSEEGDFSTPSSTTGHFDQGGSLDTEALTLKRMLDKKTQAFDLYSQMLSAYNNAAKNVIEKIRS
jgi:hypothetical protein